MGRVWDTALVRHRNDTCSLTTSALQIDKETFLWNGNSVHL